MMNLYRRNASTSADLPIALCNALLLNNFYVGTLSPLWHLLPPALIHIIRFVL